MKKSLTGATIYERFDNQTQGEEKMKSQQKMAIAVLALLGMTGQALGQDWGKKNNEGTSDYTLNIFGISRHPQSAKTSTMDQTNPGVGLRMWSDGKFLGGRPYVEGNLILRNSNGGDSETLGIGLDWTIYRGEVLRFHGGAQVFALRYHNAKKNRTMHAIVPAVHSALAWGPHALNVAMLPKKILFIYYSYDF